MLTALRNSPILAPSPQAQARVPGRAARVLAMLLVLGAAVTRLSASDFDLRDLQQEVMVREALAQDSRLQPLNLIVRVKDRVATLSGPVPSRELARRALDVARKMPELREVRDKMSVQSEDAGQMLPRPLKMPGITPPGMMLPPFAPAPPNVPEPKNAQHVAVGVWLPVHPEPDPRPLHGVALLPWITPQPSLNEAMSRPKDTSLAKATDQPDAAAVSSAVQSVIEGEERFRRLRFEVKQGKVYLSGSVSRWADFEDLARAVMRIPGVERVVLRGVKTDPPRT
jgi:osmotically-inducible protein OsmY